MKPFLMFLGIVAAGVLGYFTEPAIWSSIAGPAKETPVTPSQAPLDGPSAADLGYDLASLTSAQLPKKVILKEENRITDDASGLTITVAANSPAKLIRIEGDMVAVRPGDTAYTISVPISKTDLIEQLLANPPPPAPETPAATPEPEPAAVPAVTPAAGDSEEPPVVPEPVVEPQPEPQPEPAAEPEPEPQPEPMAEPEPQPEPEPTPAPAVEPPPAPATTAAPAAPANAVAVMQASIRDGQIKEFTLAQVTSWNAGPDETVDGETYQTGTASYKAETIFGMKTIQAKALIKDGKVARWIWPKSGMEIK